MIYATSSNPTIRALLFRCTTPLLLSVACITLISHHLSISELAHRLQEQADSTEFEHLADRVVGVEQSVMGIDVPRDVVNRAELNEWSSALHGRMSDMQKVMDNTVSHSEVQAILHRLQQLESHQHHILQTPKPAKPVATPRKAKKAEQPTFEILGREVRSGERFLSIIPAGSQSLSQSRLLRIGESYAGWKLEDFDNQTALFVLDGVTHRLNIR